MREKWRLSEAFKRRTGGESGGVGERNSGFGGWDKEARSVCGGGGGGGATESSHGGRS